MKNILFILRKAPYGGAYNQEILDMAMTAAAFDQAVSVMLMDDAVMHLLEGQAPAFPGVKNLNGVFKALPLYDIDTVFVERESLTACGLRAANFSDSVTFLHRSEIGATLRQFDILLTG